MVQQSIPSECSALFLSDSHGFHPLNGAIHRQAKILQHMRPEELHLVGDIIDFEVLVHLLKSELGLKREEFPEDFSVVYNKLEEKWPYFEVHLRFIDLIFERVRQGMDVVYEPGNHDENLDKFDEQELLGMKIQKQAAYDVGLDQYIRVEHGHRFDPGWLQRNTDWYRRGSRILDIALRTDVILSKSFKRLYYKQKSARDFVKQMLRRGENHANQMIEQIDPDLRVVCEKFFLANGVKALGKTYVRSFEERAVEKAHRKGAVGILCGHIHKARCEMKNVYTPDGDMVSDQDESPVMNRDEVLYLNAGDGLTHGAAMIHNRDNTRALEDQFQVLAGKTLKTSWSIVKQNVDPAVRKQTMEFLQVGWASCLEMLKEKEPAEEHAMAQSVA